MADYKYENHVMTEPKLPFILHPKYTQRRRTNIANWHVNIELLHCIDGSGYVRCGMERTEFQPGEIFVVNPDTPHCIGSEESISYRCLIIDSSFCEENGIPVGQLTFQSLIRDAGLRQQYEEIFAAYEKRDSGDLCAIADIRYGVLGLLRQLCRGYAKPATETRSDGDKYVKKAISYIRQNMAQEITLDGVADHAGISKFHLARQFKAYTGSTVIATVNLIRCTEARRMIEGGRSVSEAAAACGFENLSYFTRSFKKCFSMVPSDCIRRKNGKSIDKPGGKG